MPPARERPRYWKRYIAEDGTWRDDSRRPPGEDLAALRAGLGHEAGTIPAMWPFYRSAVDDRLARASKVSPEQHAEHAALALYGLHQQTIRVPMHRPGIRLGQALRQLHAKDDGKGFSPEAVDRRVKIAASATRVPALLIHLRGLVSQLRTVSQPLDYDLLEQDILAWHNSESRRRARRRWGLDYFEWSQTRDALPGDAAAR
ncbi:type I-E CRISPR-associated protein Cse2/CasB [Herbidospora daliensis]|uniref:type I-E CRISPR-associated protein Cse2/CasB n=1 Tax=Herbidospora daliensis TaxID=295585 RepID=UPI000782EA00|nr:type I-E CRISPR-associated protein Cse2/CasB [Herbidospora daliensis]